MRIILVISRSASAWNDNACRANHRMVRTVLAIQLIHPESGPFSCVGDERPRRRATTYGHCTPRKKKNPFFISRHPSKRSIAVEKCYPTQVRRQFTFQINSLNKKKKKKSIWLQRELVSDSPHRFCVRVVGVGGSARFPVVNICQLVASAPTAVLPVFYGR